MLLGDICLVEGHPFLPNNEDGIMLSHLNESVNTHSMESRKP